MLLHIKKLRSLLKRQEICMKVSEQYSYNGKFAALLSS